MQEFDDFDFESVQPTKFHHSLKHGLSLFMREYIQALANHINGAPLEDLVSPDFKAEFTN